MFTTFLSLILFRQSHSRRSSQIHVQVLSIDIEAADKTLNIYEVFTGQHLGGTQGVIANAWPSTPDQKTPAHSPMPEPAATFVSI